MHFWPADGGARHLHSGPGRFDLLRQRLDIVTGLIELSARLVEARLVGARIDFKQQVAGADELIVPNRQGDDGAGDARRDLDHVRLHLSVAGPGVREKRPVLDQNGHDGEEKIAPVMMYFRLDFIAKVPPGQNGMSKYPTATVYSTAKATKTRGG